MTLKQAVAKQLMQSNVGLKLAELTDRIDKQLFNNSNNISTVLTELKHKGHVENGPGYNNSPSRWRITAQGRAFYSTLNQDNDNASENTWPSAEDQNKTEQDIDNSGVDLGELQHAAASDLETDQKLPPIDVLYHANGPEKPVQVAADSKQEPKWVDIEAHDFAVLKFNTAETLDRALYGLVKLIRDVAKQEPQPISIDNKQDALDLLETMESNTLIHGTARATFARIRHAVEQMEDAEC